MSATLRPALEERDGSRAMEGLPHEQRDRKEICGRADWHVLADLGRLRHRCHCRFLSPDRRRLARCFIRLRTHRADNGLCHWTRLGVPSQSGGDSRPHGGRALPAEPGRALHCGAGGGCDSCRGCPLSDRQRRAQLRRSPWLRRQWLRRALARSVRPARPPS